MISLCLIVKNEEETLFKCLDSAKNIAQEIIIIDTGSTDRTKEIALNFTDKVYDFAWCNDFSKARNFSISKASNDWILVLDADEVVIDFHIQDIQSFCSEGNKRIVGRLKRINEYEDEKGNKKYIERVNRVFNKNFFTYEGIIHEQIVSKNKGKYITKDINLVIDHIGYSKEVLNRTNKIQRNIELLKKALEKNFKDPYLHYQLGKSYFMGKDYDNAYIYFKKAIYLVDDFNYEYAEDLVESYGYALIHLNLFKEALELIKYEKYYNNSPDFLFIIGLIYMNNNCFQKSAETFLRCTEFKEGKIEGITSYLPLYNIGVIFECLGFKEEALNYYNLCGDYIPATDRVKKL
ncbi:glycosyl transferase [Clostridium botulinum]|uniref:Glycosyl transferase n=1 Tax=Clostridium botulinum TaxID=1491 RepID=A0AAU8YUV3_CLOBO|nr:glycosyltransferase family 2 protein [Clostridium sporogenes]AVP64046.1 glycosyl transferase [Clostridium botulinum]MBW5456429.1 glycosyltransferase [Clostridium sporogenes]MCF4016627.1 glycosyltransferase [Clostridium sporogenes]MDS1006779.1 glycosyltransferase [Clostridium sporogenes]NFG03753.1 glycosyltransferase [Clostridium sporogenes]